MSTVTIYHNPQCGTSRNTLALIRNAGLEPRVVHYLETPPTRDELVRLIEACGLSVREVMRSKGDLFDELNLGDEKWSDEQLIDFMVEHPILINRPIVVTERGTLLCRPSERVLDILVQPQQGPFTKEDGEVVIDAQGRRVR
jgi:arsenate reductase